MQLRVIRTTVFPHAPESMLPEERRILAEWRQRIATSDEPLLACILRTLFRLATAIGVRHAVLISTVLYVLATVAGGNLVLVFTAAVLGTVVGLERRASGGILAPILTHVTWSLSMLFVLPPLFAAAT